MALTVHSPTLLLYLSYVNIYLSLVVDTSAVREVSLSVQVARVPFLPSQVLINAVAGQVKSVREFSTGCRVSRHNASLYPFFDLQKVRIKAVKANSPFIV